VSWEEGLERERLLLLRAWKKLQSDADPVRRSATWVSQLAEIKRRLAAIEEPRAAQLKRIATTLAGGGTIAECWDRLSDEDRQFIEEEVAMTDEEDRLAVELEEAGP
jgi:hypothetical protein